MKHCLDEVNIPFQTIGGDLPKLYPGGDGSYQPKQYPDGDGSYQPKRRIDDWHSSVTNQCQNAENAREDSERV